MRLGFTTSTLMLACALMLFQGMPLSAWADKNQLSESHLKKLRADITELQAYLKQAQDDHKELVSSLRKSDKEVAEISEQVESLKKALQEERDRLKKLRAEQETLQKTKNQQQQTLKNILLATYKMGQEPQLKMLLNQKDPALVTRNLTLLKHINEAHQKDIDDYRSTLSQLGKTEAEVAKKQASIARNLNSLRDSHRELKAKQKAQQIAARKLDQNIQGSHQKLSRLQEDRQNLMSLLGKVEEVFLPYERDKESRPFRQLKGKLPNPIQNIRPKRMYGMVQSNGKQKWQGWLYPASQGTDVRTVHHGRIVFSDWLRGFGLLTIVDHGQGYMSLYARNQALLRSVGDWVEAGDIIARSGRSGGYEEAALYFEIRHKGEPQNPKRWLKKS